MNESNFESFYKNVPVIQREALRQFRRTHPLQQAIIGNTSWHYIDAGPGPATVLILVGGLRVADAAYPAIRALEQDFRLIVPTYPPLATVEALVDGITGLLDTLEVPYVHILAGSFGGMVAQGLLQHAPQRVQKLVLSSTGIPADLRAYRRSAWLLRFMSDALVRRISQKRLLKIIAPPSDQVVFWQAYLNELFSVRLGKRDVLSTFRCVIDFVENHSVTRNVVWPGQVLIIGAQDDTTFDEAAQNALRVKYPQAQLHIFPQAGHSPSMTRPDEYFAVVREFLQR